MEPVKNILICRTDNIRSLVLTTPVFRAIRKTFPEAKLTVMVSPLTAPIIENNPFVDRIILDDKDNLHSGAAGFMRLSKELENLKFDTALLPYSNWRLLSLTVSAGIKRRIANGFRPYLPLINKPVWLHKSHPPIHETQYALSFIEPIGEPEREVPAPEIFLSDGEKKRAREWLNSKVSQSDGPLVGIHPVSHDPAFTPSLDMWHKLAEHACRKIGARALFITGTDCQRDIAQRLCKAATLPTVNVAGDLSLRELCAVQSQLSLFMAPNSGPLHTAAASGAPVIGLFPPMLTMSREKWQPLNEKVAIIQPNLRKHCIKCMFAKCQLYPCLDTITTNHIDAAMKRLGLLPS